MMRSDKKAQVRIEKQRVVIEIMYLRDQTRFSKARSIAMVLDATVEDVRSCLKPFRLDEGVNCEEVGLANLNTTRLKKLLSDANGKLALARAEVEEARIQLAKTVGRREALNLTSD